MLHPEALAPAPSPPLPHDILVRICQHLAADVVPPPVSRPRDYVHKLYVSTPPASSSSASPTSPAPPACAPAPRPSPTSTLLAILFTGWHGYHAALPYLYAHIEGADLPAVCAGIAPCADHSAWPEVEAWPNAASCVRKVEALRSVRRLSVGSWPGLRPSAPESESEDAGSDVDPDELGTYDWEAGLELGPADALRYDALLALQRTTPLFPRLEAVVFHSRAMLEALYDAGDLFERIAESPLYQLLRGERAPRVCVHIPRWESGASATSYGTMHLVGTPYIGFLQHLCKAWATKNPTTTPPKLTIHDFELSSPPIVDDSLGLHASRVHLWPRIPNATYGGDLPWAANLDEWYELIYWAWRQFGHHSLPRVWEVAGVRPIVPLTCAHADDYAASAFWLKVLLQKDMIDLGERHRRTEGGSAPLFDLEMPHAAATEGCAACGAQFGGDEKWWSAPLAEALVSRGSTAMEVGEKMRVLDSEMGSGAGKGSCNAHGWDVAHMAKAVERECPVAFAAARERIVDDMLRDADKVLRQR